MQEKNEHTSSISVKVDVDSSNVDAAIEKVTRLVVLLQEAERIIDSLSARNISQA